MTFQSSWNEYEKKIPYPTKARNIIIYDFGEFKKKVINENQEDCNAFVKSLMQGDFFLLKSAYSQQFMNELKVNSFNFFKNKPSKFYKMIEGTPDFHRKIDLETGKKYSFRACKHSFYFYPWNDDPLNIFKPIYDRWRIIKKLMGLNPKAYENNTPIDGIVDRVQVVRYPSKIGFLDLHSDPYQFQKLIISAYMSKKNIDFDGIGFYLLDKNDDILPVEDFVDVGDIGIGMATMYHGVAPVNTFKEPDWNDMDDGRWFLSTYSNASDEVKYRHTSSTIKTKLNLKDNIRKKIKPSELL
jgi:hypothetical protein